MQENPTTHRQRGGSGLGGLREGVSRPHWRCCGAGLRMDTGRLGLVVSGGGGGWCRGHGARALGELDCQGHLNDESAHLLVRHVRVELLHNLQRVQQPHVQDVSLRESKCSGGSARGADCAPPKALTSQAALHSALSGLRLHTSSASLMAAVTCWGCAGIGTRWVVRARPGCHASTRACKPAPPIAAAVRVADTQRASPPTGRRGQHDSR